MLYLISTIKKNNKFTTQLLHKHLLLVYFNKQLQYKIKMELTKYSVTDANDVAVLESDNPFAVIDRIHQ